MEDTLVQETEFWRYMVEAGAVDSELAEEFASCSRSKWVPLGQVLIQRDVLDISQVMGLLKMQADEPELRLGDLAIREGLCSHEQVRDALAEQRSMSPHPIEMILRDKRLEPGSFFGPLIAYVRFLEGRLHAVSST